MFSRWFRSSPSPFQTPLAMIGAKAGDRLLVAGAARPELVAELASVTGLNGSTIVADPSADAALNIDRAAEAAGAVIEFLQTSLVSVPRETGSVDVVVIPDPAHVSDLDRPGVFKEMFRLLRRGGRLVVIDGGTRRASFGRVHHDAATFPPDAIIATLRSAGGQAVRLLATTDRISYFEARGAPRPPDPLKTETRP